MLEKILEKSLDKIPIEILYGIGLAALVLAIILMFFSKSKVDSISSILNVPISDVNGICVEENGLTECITFQIKKKGLLTVTESKFGNSQTYIKFKVVE